MLDALKPLPEDPAELRAVSERLMAEVQSQAYQIEKLKAELHGHRKARFGSKSESLDQLAFDLAEDAEIEAAAEAQRTGPAEADGKPPKRQHSRKPLPDHLERQNEMLSIGEECGACGGSSMPGTRADAGVSDNRGSNTDFRDLYGGCSLWAATAARPPCSGPGLPDPASCGC